MEIQQSASATLIGDVVDSRNAADRPALHGVLTDALAEANRRWRPAVPLRITVGDEYQGAFGTVGTALQVSLWLRIALLPAYDVRHGLGWGAVEVLAAEPRVEDGPGWWAAREAIQAVQRAEGSAATRWCRTSFRRAPGTHGPDPAAVEAALALRDGLVDGLDERGLSVLGGLLAGRTQRDIAAELGVTASAVSQRVRADRLGALVRADGLLGEVR